MWPKYHQHMTSCDQELHLIRETSPSVKRTQNDGSSKDDIIPYHHQRSAVCFSSLHDRKCCALLILLIEVPCTSSYHSLSANRIRSCYWISHYPLSLMDISDTQGACTGAFRETRPPVRSWECGCADELPQLISRNTMKFCISILLYRLL